MPKQNDPRSLHDVLLCHRRFAQFSNVDGLVSQGGGVFTESRESGPGLIGAARLHRIRSGRDSLSLTQVEHESNIVVECTDQPR